MKGGEEEKDEGREGRERCPDSLENGTLPGLISMCCARYEWKEREEFRERKNGKRREGGLGGRLGVRERSDAEGQNVTQTLELSIQQYIW